MQIFLKSHTSSFSRGKSTSGFTLPELLISIAIIGIVTSITLVKYSSFDSTVLTKSAAYEVALTLREAQINSVSVKRGEGDADDGVFSFPYGVHITEDSSTYTAFVYEDASNIYPFYGGAYTEDVGTFTMERGMKVVDICINDRQNCNFASMDISFRRPEFNALFYGDTDDNDPTTVVQNNTVDDVQIDIQSPSGIHVFTVEVSKLGQISVHKQ